ncbi:hypothetical protein [Streptomyces solaniscabiei]|uniref:hypothetical protein n=1 Tax=Streptomyces solaniscabiei TaxID=2683255 RepID=UPI001CE30C7F|nr:hypothetical protein [Streptomyces solaniscabiei]
MSETELLALLRELDDPERLEQPLHYDRAATGPAFSGLVRRLEVDFEAPCESERDTQDSSEYGRIHRRTPPPCYGGAGVRPSDLFRQRRQAAVVRAAR